MAMTKTIQTEGIDIVFPNNAVGSTAEKSLLITEKINIDDPDDDLLPVVQRKSRRIEKYTAVDVGDGVFEDQLTDISGESQLVQDICALIWPSE